MKAPKTFQGAPISYRIVLGACSIYGWNYGHSWGNVPKTMSKWGSSG